MSTALILLGILALGASLIILIINLVPKKAVILPGCFVFNTLQHLLYFYFPLLFQLRTGLS